MQGVIPEGNSLQLRVVLDVNKSLRRGVVTTKNDVPLHLAVKHEKLPIFFLKVWHAHLCSEGVSRSFWKQIWPIAEGLIWRARVGY